jgi:uncharacterized protein YvpB
MFKSTLMGGYMKKRRLILIIVSSLIFTIVLAISIPFIVLGVKQSNMYKDYNYLFEENKIIEHKIEVVPLIKQDISCGYAIIEMMSLYYGNEITEKELYEKNNKSVSTQTTKGFVDEINNSIPNLNYVSYEYLSSDKLLLKINESICKDLLVAVEFAAKLEDEWTLHWAIVTGMDKEKIYINNPYGYKEEITYAEFISRTTFNAFENMPFFFNFGFAFGLFSKNTIIVSNLD